MFLDFLPLFLFAGTLALGILLNNMFSTMYDQSNVEAENYSDI